MRCYRAVREIPECKLALISDETNQQQENCLADGVPVSLEEVVASEPDLPNEPSHHSMIVEAAPVDSEQEQQPATDTEVPAQPVTSEQPTAAAAEQKAVAQSSSNAYLYAVIPNLDSIIAENDFSSVDALKR